MNQHKCFIIAIVWILSSMTIGMCFSVTDQTGAPNLLMKNEMNLTIGSSGPQEEWNQTFGGLRMDIGTSVKPVIEGVYIIAGTKNALGSYNGGDCLLVKTDNYGGN